MTKKKTAKKSTTWRSVDNDQYARLQLTETLKTVELYLNQSPKARAEFRIPESTMLSFVRSAIRIYGSKTKTL